jgi:predicted nucleotidyltransferase
MEEALSLLGREMPPLVAVYAFGSAGTDAERDDSDIDLAFLAESAVDPVRVFDVAGKLASILGRDVDLVDLWRASTVMRAQVVSRGICILDGDRSARQRFEVHTYSSYARLNEERAGILADIQSRGRIHG